MADANAQAIVARFRILTSEARRAAYRGILDQLRPQEWRDVKDRYRPKTFQCDLVGNLPLEIVALVAEFLNMADLVFLQRVSRQWRRVLTSPLVCGAALRAAFGPDALTVNSPGELPKLLKRGLRMERGLPAVRATYASPNPPNLSDDFIPMCDSYGDGLYAWIEVKTQRTSITVVDLWTGHKDRLSTENRESLTELCISRPFIAALAKFGYCHVWNLHTHTQKSFRLPSLSTGHFFICGTKIAVGFYDSIVCFCFDSGLTRTIPVTDPVLVALNPTKDEFIVALLRTKDDADLKKNIRIPIADARLYIRTYALDSSNQDFHCVRSHYQDLPVENPGDEIFLQTSRQVIRGQSGSIMILLAVRSDQPADLRHSVYLSLEPETDRVVVHSLLSDLVPGNLAPMGKRIVYTSDTSDTHDHMVIFSLCHTRLSASSSEADLYQYSPARTVQEQKFCDRILGDAEFVVLDGFGEITIWSWDETWEPPAIPELAGY